MGKEKKFQVNLAVFATGIMAFSGVLIETAMNVTFPTLIRQFGINTAQVQWVTTIYLLMISIIVPLSSYLIRNYSIHNLFKVAISLFLAGVLVNSFAINFAVLLLGRLLQGVATGIGLPLMFNIILTKVPLEKRGMMIGVGTLTTSIAPALGPTYGGLLTSHLGWPFIYIFLLPLLIIAAIAGLLSIPAEKVVKQEPLNKVAAFFLALMFTAFLLMFSYFGSSLFWIAIIIGILSGLLFFESNKKVPLLDLRLFLNPSFRRYLFGFLVFQGLLLGISFVLPNSMQLAFATPASKAGIMMFPGALIGAIFAPISGRLLDNFGAKKPILSGLVIAIIGWTMLSLFMAQGSVLLLVLSHVIFMVGVGLSYSNLMTVGLSSISKEEQGDGNAIFSTLQQFTGAIATAFVALIMNLAQNSADNFVAGTLTGARIDLYSLLALLAASLVIVTFNFVKNSRIAD